MDKVGLRREFKRRRVSLSPPEHAETSARINERLLAVPQVQVANIVLSYVAHGTEVDNRTALRRLLECGKRILVPASRNPDEALHCFHYLTKDDPVLEQLPSDRSLLCDFREIGAIDLFIVPGIAWDECGYRIGYGGGYFDRLLAKRRASAVLIGLAFEVQIAESIPREAWDVPVDIIITENRSIEVNRQ